VKTHDVEGIAGYPRAGHKWPALRPRSYAGWPEGTSEHIGGDFRCHCRGGEAQWLF
jgi:hypothetical protein